MYSFTILPMIIVVSTNDTNKSEQVKWNNSIQPNQWRKWDGIRKVKTLYSPKIEQVCSGQRTYGRKDNNMHTDSEVTVNSWRDEWGWESDKVAPAVLTEWSAKGKDRYNDTWITSIKRTLGREEIPIHRHQPCVCVRVVAIHYWPQGWKERSSLLVERVEGKRRFSWRNTKWWGKCPQTAGRTVEKARWTCPSNFHCCM